MARLGPFEVEEELARGGMGVVLRGVHRASDTRVAVKVIGPEHARAERFYEDFQREVRAAAQLDHANVVTLLDYGLVPEDAERETDGGLVAKSPYLVMELADSGSLQEHPPAAWPELRRHFEALLEALAHAHSHGLIHRDLKPGNVLLHRGAAEQPYVKLADFGLAHASDRRHESAPDLEQMAGTPSFMAPEQIQCHWRDYGPWTDLYALGVMAFGFVTGELPYRGDSAIQLLYMQLMEPLPDVVPAMDVPRGLDGWIERLCKKSPNERFACAADALAALRALDRDAAISAAAPMRADLAVALESTQGALPFAAPPWLSAPASREPRAPMKDLAREVPESWRAPTRAPLQLLGAGLGLYFLRPVPLVDREPDRDALWAALRACDREKRARAVVLRGAAGIGKSRLAAWITERALELGAACVLRAEHASSPGPTHGLAHMVAAHYRAVGLRGGDLRARLERCLEREGSTDRYDLDALLALIGEDPETPDFEKRISVRFSSPIERHVVVEGVLARASAERPAIVWIDDAQWGADAVLMVQHALDALEARVLFVITVRDDALGEREVERAAVEAIEAHARGLRVEVSALADVDSATLVEQLLGLRGDLAHRVRQRASGNPLFAVQLVGDWVQRGVLSLTPTGFALQPGERAELPDDLHAVWIDRVDRVLADRTPADRELVELAATLGSSVDRAELDELSRAWGESTPFPAPLLDVLMRANLTVPTESGFAFAHGMLHESIARASARAGRAAAMHRACVRLLSSREGRGIDRRRAHHLAEAGDLEAALEPLLRAARESLNESDYPEVRILLARREEIAAKLALSESDERWGAGWVLRADAHRMEWDFEAAERWASNALAVAEKWGWTLTRAESLHVLSHVARQHGDLDRAQERNRRALDLFDRAQNDDGRARTLLAMAIVARQQGGFDRAEELYRRAGDVFELVGDARGAGNALLGLAHIARHHREHEDAEEKYERARELFEHAGYRSGVAHCLMGRADLLRYRGELAPSEQGYREALRIQRSLGSKATFIPRLNLGLVLLAQDRFEQARVLFEEILPEVAQKGAYLGLAHTFLLPCAVALGDLAAFDRHLEARRAAAKVIVDEDLAETAERAGRMLLAIGERDRARAALEIAEEAWRALGDAARADGAKIA
jgi:eukaryotic-like serine/threonine-protein kinase